MLTAACYTWGRIPGLISTFVISVPWKLGSSTSLRRLEPCCQGLQHTKGGTQARAGLQPLQHSKAAAVIGPSLWLLSLFGANSCKVCQSIQKYLFPPHLIPTPTNLPIYKGQSTTTLPEKPKWETWGVEATTGRVLEWSSHLRTGEAGAGPLGSGWNYKQITPKHAFPALSRLPLAPTTLGPTPASYGCKGL